MPLSFVKLHGLGNDFIVVDRRAEGTPLPRERALALCDRHRGIGADGVLSLLPSREAPLAMHVTNADGSVAEMCGNGLRCVVRHAVDRGLLPPEGGVVETGAGLRPCRVEPGGEIRVDMGRPELRPERVPVALASPAAGERIVDAPLEVEGASLHFTAVSMGNPHAVIFVDAGPSLRELALQLGPALERHPLFPRRTNVEFARFVAPRVVDLVVWERGAGLTQACGTGACATAVAAVLTGRAVEGEPLEIRLPGGSLRVEVEPAFARVWMTGPAVEVFSGVTSSD